MGTRLRHRVRGAGEMNEFRLRGKRFCASMAIPIKGSERECKHDNSHLQYVSGRTPPLLCERNEAPIPSGRVLPAGGRSRRRSGKSSGKPMSWRCNCDVCSAANAFCYTVRMSPTAALDRVFEPISRCLTPTVAQKIVDLRADQELNARIQELAEKANEGQLTESERSEYESYVRAIDLISILQSKARRFLANTRKKR